MPKASKEVIFYTCQLKQNFVQNRTFWNNQRNPKQGETFVEEFISTYGHPKICVLAFLHYCLFQEIWNHPGSHFSDYKEGTFDIIDKYKIESEILVENITTEMYQTQTCSKTCFARLNHASFCQDMYMYSYDSQWNEWS